MSWQGSRVKAGDTLWFACLVSAFFSAVFLAVFTSSASAAPVPGDPCSNGDIRLEQNVAFLPDCMAIELVSPSRKFNQRANNPHVSANGQRIRFLSPAGLAETPGLLDPFGDPYVATRGPSGWETLPTSPPAGFFYGWRKNAEPLSFTPDFSSWFQIAATLSQRQMGIAQVFQGRLDGSFSLLFPALVPLGGGVPLTVEASDLQGASEDHSHLYFRPGPKAAGGADRLTSYLSGDPSPSGPGADYNVYAVAFTPSDVPFIVLLSRDGEGKVWGGNCGARLGGIGEFVGVGPFPAPNGNRNQHAISTDGTRVYFSARAAQPESGPCTEANKLRILKRIEAQDGPWISRLLKEPSGDCDRVAPPCSAADGDDLYQGASMDGTKVYFTTNRTVADSDLDDSASQCSLTIAQPGCDLYLYDSTLPPGQRLIQVSAGETVPGLHEAGKEAKVFNSVAAISGDGSHVYFAAENVLTSDKNPEDGEAQPGQPNLYVWDSATKSLAFIGALASGDQGALWGGEGTFKNNAYPVPAVDENLGQIGGDGHILLFLSKAPLTADDGDGLSRDLFRYDAESEQLERISKAVPGGNDNGAFDVASRGNPFVPGTDFAEDGRWASEDGETVVFSTNETLVPDGIGGDGNSYLWRRGQLVRLPGGTPVLSHDGSTAAFTTPAQLLPEDGDSIGDVYAARVEGGFRKPPPIPVCIPNGNEGCQGSSDAVPSVPSAQGLGLLSQGNVKLDPVRNCPRGKRRVQRKGKTRCVKRPNHEKRTSRKQGGQR